MKINFFLLSVISGFILISCNNNDDNLGNVTPGNDFIINVERSFKEDQFIIITDQNQEILYREKGASIPSQIIVKSVYDKLDVTYGSEGGGLLLQPNLLTFPFIRTYRDVASGFTIPGNSVCFDSITPKNSLGRVSYLLEITGINNYEKIYWAMVASEIVADDSMPNSILLKGQFFNEQNAYLTILPIGSAAHKTMLVQFDDWSFPREDSAFLTIDINEMIEPVVYEITLNANEEWAVNANSINSEGIYTRILGWGNSDNIQNGNKISIFTTPEFDFDQLELTLNSFELTGKGYFHEAIYSQIPDKINLNESAISNLELSSSQFSYSIQGQNDFLISRYQYPSPENLGFLGRSMGHHSSLFS